MKSYIYAIAFFLVLGAAVGVENYMDYGEENDDRNVDAIYRILFQRGPLISSQLRAGPMTVDSPNHLMIRKSQRSPSLRLRFGRSDPAMPQENVLTRSSGSGIAAFEDK